MTQPDLEALRGILNLRVGDTARVIARHALPRPPTGWGLADGELNDLLAVLEEVKRSASLTRLFEAEGRLGPLGRVDVWDRRTSVLLLSGSAANPEVLSGRSIRTGNRDVLVVADGDRAVVRLVSSTDELIVATDGSSAWLLEVARNEAHPLRALDSYEPASQPSFRAPGLDELVGDDPGPAWLVDAYRRLAARATTEDAAAAVGLVHRLWSPSTAEGRRFLVERALAGEATDGPPARVKDVVRGVPEDVWTYLEGVVMERSDDLLERLRRVGSVVAQDPADAAAVVHELLLERDDLESLAVLLELTGRREHVAPTLELLDREAITHLTALADAASSAAQDERLLTVHWQEPGRWWAEIARP